MTIDAASKNGDLEMHIQTNREKYIDLLPRAIG